MEDFVRRLCACGYPDGVARSICVEFFRELGRDWLADYVADIEQSFRMAVCYVETL